MKFGQLIVYNTRNIFLEKSYTKYGGKTIFSRLQFLSFRENKETKRISVQISKKFKRVDISFSKIFRSKIYVT